jgi:hypothetical protein
MKKAIERFREPKDREFSDVDLPITTENFDPTLNRANTNHCLLVAREKGNTVFVVVGTKWTEGSKFLFCFANHMYFFSIDERVVICYDLQMNNGNMDKFFAVQSEIDDAIRMEGKRKFVVDEDIEKEKKNNRYDKKKVDNKRPKRK